jgi:hypothetical protein
MPQVRYDYAGVACQVMGCGDRQKALFRTGQGRGAEWRSFQFSHKNHENAILPIVDCSLVCDRLRR